MPIDLTLHRVRQLFSSLPAYTRPTLHIAGTNGKGSVTAILSSILTASNIPVGRFNSPHLIHVRDAISLSNCPVSQETYRAARAVVERANSAQASSFEIMTATAAQIFEHAHVEVAIFEVGLGGRLDATNVLPDDAILASAVTSVDLDHQQFLGSTPAAIAREKAAIARPARPCVLGAQVHPEVEHAVRGVVLGVGGELVNAVNVTLLSSTNRSQTVTAPFPAWDTTLELELPLLGAHQRDNLAVALTLLSTLIERRACLPVLDRITPSTLRSGVLNTKWPGRIEHIRLRDPPLTLLVDGAHNPASAAALQAYLSAAAAPSPRTFILALSHSPPKTPHDTLAPLLRSGDRVAFVPFSDVDDMPWVRNVPLSDLRDVTRGLVEGEVAVFGRSPDDEALGPLRRALAWAHGGAGVGEVVLAGSLYLVADLYRIAELDT